MFAPTSRIVAGSEVEFVTLYLCIYAISSFMHAISLHVVGYAGEIPFTFGSLPIEFGWRSSNTATATVTSHYHKSKVPTIFRSLCI